MQRDAPRSMLNTSPSAVALQAAKPASSHTGAPGTIIELSTDGVPPAQRLDYWQHAHLDRMTLSRPANDAGVYSGWIRRILGTDTHLMEHGSNAIVATRTRAHARRDGVDYVSINLLLRSAPGTMEHMGEHKLQSGSLYFVDSALPVEFHHQAHHCISVFLPRQKLQQAGVDVKHMPVALQALSGVGAVLQSHMRMIAREASQLTPDQRCVMVTACAEMALAAAQAVKHTRADAQQFEGGFFQAALRLIEARCTDPQLDPEALSQALGCSRATLYRMFSGRGESVSARIWLARLACAHKLLCSASHAAVPLAEIAFRSGFLDQAGFNRMFKRQYGMTPGEARLEASLRTQVPRTEEAAGIYRA